jgi:diguanylate cyclase (GGDEF)-like protein/PAS domain S-box-containing protein
MSKFGESVHAIPREQPFRDDAAQLRLIADNLPAMSIAYDENLRCMFANRRFAEFFGLSTANIVGKHLREIVGEDAYQEVKPYFDQVLEGRPTTYKRTRVLGNGELRYLEVELIPHIAEKGRVKGLFAVTTDVTERKREERLRILGHSVGSLIAEAESSSLAMQAVIRAICETERWECGRYFQPPVDGAPLRLVEAWGIDDAAVQRFLERSRHIEYVPGFGLVSEVWQSGQAQWVADVSKDPRSVRKAFSPELGVWGAFIFPVKSQGMVIGVLTFNCRQIRAPDERLLQAILTIGSQIGQFLQRKRAEEQLRESEARFRGLTELSADWYWEQDAQLRFVATAGATDARGGITPAAHIGKCRWELPGTEIVNQTWAEHKALLAACHPFRNLIIRRADDFGEVRFVSVTGEPMFDVQGRLRGYRGVASDITARVRAEEQLKESEARFRSLTELSSDVFWEHDAQYRFTSLSDASGRINPGSIVGKTLWELDYNNMAAEDWDAHRAILDAHQPFRDLEVCHRSRSGNEVWYSVSGTPMFDQSGAFTGYRGVGRAITERKLDEKRIRYLANHDPLTGLPNRTSFSDVLSASIKNAQRHGRSLAVMFVDLDRFKIINDTLGHEAGDEVLREVGIRLRHTLRASDVIARLGGDEFVVLVQEVKDAIQMETVARKILAALVRPMFIQAQECAITASIGICSYPGDGENEQSLMKNADTAMYQAKEAGKNNFKFYSHEPNSNSFQRLAMETSLRYGLRRNEFFLEYQPRINLKSGAVTGVEALVRWQHPELGVIPPGQFIPLAEETGVILELGTWVLATACAQAVAWQKEGLPALRMAVNLSARQFADENLVEHIVRALGSSGLAPGFLELELTESVVAQNVERAATVLRQIRDLGVQLALDDFGTGYSSLAQLKRFPIDTLKIDRSFVAGLPHSGEDAAITLAIIALGRGLDLVLIAEGVETEEQQAFLRRHACNEMQGFLFSRPLGAADCADLLRQQSRPS